jgi:hypothetical protein
MAIKKTWSIEKWGVKLEYGSKVAASEPKFILHYFFNLIN